MSHQLVKGVIPAVITPFDDQDRVNLEALATIVEHLLDQGCNGIMTTGGTGEFPHLDRAERKAVIATSVEASRGRQPVIAGTAACSVREALALSEDAVAVGAAAVILVPPYYFPLPEAAILSFFFAIADRVPAPVVVYNNPLYTGNAMRPSLIVELLQHPNVIGLKQSQSDLGQLAEVMRMVRTDGGSDRSILTGIDSQFLAALAIGSDGIFSTAAGIVPGTVVDLYRRFMDGDLAGARAVHDRLQALNRHLEYDPGYVAPAKEGLRMLGFDAGAPRAPLPGLTDLQRDELRAALSETTAATNARQ
jgi:4-hydroxy-tetrahydrodipicolinate synthase